MIVKILKVTGTAPSRIWNRVDAAMAKHDGMVDDIGEAEHKWVEYCFDLESEDSLPIDELMAIIREMGFEVEARNG